MLIKKKKKTLGIGNEVLSPNSARKCPFCQTGEDMAYLKEINVKNST